MCCMKSNNSVNIFTLKYIHTKVFIFRSQSQKRKRKILKSVKQNLKLIFSVVFLSNN